MRSFGAWRDSSVAADDLVTWMDEMRADHAELKQEVHSLRSDLEALGRRMDEGFRRIDERFTQLDAKIDRLVEHSFMLAERQAAMPGKFIAWNAAFWLSAVTVTVGLLQFLSR